MWAGVALGVYALFIGLTGAVLTFRPQLQAHAYPQYFAPRPSAAPLADPAVVLANLSTTYPGYRFTGVEYPSARRGTFLAYLSRGSELKTVFADPEDGRIIGELPHDGWIQQLQELHFDLLAGPTGYIVNGIAASALLAMCLTGLVIWWPGAGRAAQAFVVHTTRGWKRIVWELHGAAGLWAVAWLIMLSASGIYFSFPVPVRQAIGHVLTLSGPDTPRSQIGGSGRPSAAELVERAQARLPHAQLARFVVPSGPDDPFAVVLARRVHGDWDTSDEVTLYFDQHSGTWLGTSDASQRTAGDLLMTWLGLLHVGNFGGLPLRIVWCVAGLVLPLLWMTGLVMWWNRQRGRLMGPA
jgi:uncharacterized iron-regulated membrane protein